MPALRGGVAALGALTLVFARAASAQEKVIPHVMSEPGDVVDVIDAFDAENGKPFNFDFSLGYNYLSKRARITRETAIFAPGLTTGGYTSRNLEAGQYIDTTSILTPRVELGLWHDLALYFYAPIVLDDDQHINGIDGSDSNINTVAAGAPSDRGPLFQLPFQAPHRSGVRYLAPGIDWGILNQARDWTKPTWVIGIEARISAGPPMHACNPNAPPGQVECAAPGDVNRSGGATPEPTGRDGVALASADVSTRTPGITRGTVGFEAHSVISKRIKYIEPYGGLSALFEFQQGDQSDFGQTDFQGTLVNHPPFIGSVMVGMMIHPWENREKYSRLSFDLRFEGAYHSEGRDYSELFDALGSSDSASLRNPKWASYRACTTGDKCPTGTASVVDQSSARSYFSGLTVVEPFGSYRASGAVDWRIAQHVKLMAGLGLTFDQAHGITADQPCNPISSDPGTAGPCSVRSGPQGSLVTSTGIPNPAYRPVINEVGRRFYVDDSVIYEIFARGIVLF